MIFKIKNSPNFSKKPRKNKDIKAIIIHYTGMQSKIASIKRLESRKHKVSCHFLIDRKGEVLKMVNENKIAWHAGESKWKNLKNLNDSSIGIELVNKGHRNGYEKFTSKQISTLISLCLKLKKKYKIRNSNIIGHSDIAPLRKQDPGEKFPWKRLSRNGLGIWYKKLNNKLIKNSEKKIKSLFFKNIYKIGYRYFNRNKNSKKDIFIIKAFQRRFLPKEITGKINQKTLKISHYLANHIKN